MSKVWVATDDKGLLLGVFDSEYFAYDFAFDDPLIDLESFVVTEREVVGSRH